MDEYQSSHSVHSVRSQLRSHLKAGSKFIQTKTGVGYSVSCCVSVCDIFSATTKTKNINTLGIARFLAAETFYIVQFFK